MKKKKYLVLFIIWTVIVIIVTIAILYMIWINNKNQREELYDNFNKYYADKVTEARVSQDSEYNENAVSDQIENTETTIATDYKQLDVISIIKDLLENTPYERYNVVLMSEYYDTNTDRMCTLRVGSSTFEYKVIVHGDCTYDVEFIPSAFNPKSPGIDFYIMPPTEDMCLQIDNLAATLGTTNVLKVITCWGNYAELEDSVTGNVYVVNFSENTIMEGHRPEGE